MHAIAMGNIIASAELRFVIRNAAAIKNAIRKMYNADELVKIFIPSVFGNGSIWAIARVNAVLLISKANAEVSNNGISTAITSMVNGPAAMMAALSKSVISLNFFPKRRRSTVWTSELA